MTKILTSKGEDLSRVLGEVLQNEHKWKYRCKFILDEHKTCLRCGISGNMGKGEPCPIPLDWPNAMKWRDWAVEKFGLTEYRKALWKAMGLVGKIDYKEFSDKLTVLLEPEHFLKAAALCVERSKE